MSEPKQTTLPLHTTPAATAPPQKGNVEKEDVPRAKSPPAPIPSWTPNFARRQSWSAQDRKHELHMASVDDVKTGPGFTERSN